MHRCTFFIQCTLSRRRALSFPFIAFTEAAAVTFPVKMTYNLSEVKDIVSQVASVTT